MATSLFKFLRMSLPQVEIVSPKEMTILNLHSDITDGFLSQG